MNSQPIDIFQPLTVLVFWTMLVLLQIPIRRFRAAFKGEVGPGDFRHGESDRVPPHVRVPNRNYMNRLALFAISNFVLLGFWVRLTGALWLG